MKTLVLFALSSIVLVSLTGSAYAQNDPYILEKIASQADAQILNQLKGIYGDSIPSDIQVLYDHGHQAVNSLKENLDTGNIEQARQDFLAAMNSFKQITKMISASITSTQSTDTPDSDRDLQSELIRLVKYVKSIKKISDNHNTGIDFTPIDHLINQAHSEITTGTGNPTDTIDQLKRLVESAKKNIGEHASHGASDRVKQFINEQLVQIEEKLTNVSDAGANSAEVVVAYELIIEIKTLMSENKVDDAKKIFLNLIDLVNGIESSIS